MDINAKVQAYCILVTKMRNTQQEFFAASVKRDFKRKSEILPQAKALEKKVDEQTKELLILLEQNFQPELFR